MLSAVASLILVLPAPGLVERTGMPSTRYRGKPLEVTVDTSAAPDLAPWADKAVALMKRWYPRICVYLQTDGFAPPNQVKLVFRKDPKAIANTSGRIGRTITVSAKWVRQHPDDFGMIIHELVHVVQAYPRYENVWLIEGIADYVRFTQFEPKRPAPPLDLKRASYQDGYRTTADFLAWIDRTYNPDIVPRLNEAMRTASYTDDLFRHLTGKPLDRLWREYIAERRRQSGK